MPIDLKMLGDKLRRYREQFDLKPNEVQEKTGINSDVLLAIEEGNHEPSGDQILILSEFYRCDYRGFLSNERITTLDETEKLFRRYGKEFSKSDRIAVQEFLYLCECETQLLRMLNKEVPFDFAFRKTGKFFKRQGQEAASKLREYLRYEPSQIPGDVFDVFRGMGIHVFRRPLENSNISGVYINHPQAGACVLVNYTEDVYRQRFTATHEAGHAILDKDELFVVSIDHGSLYSDAELVEIRANTFASNFLLPRDALARIPSPHLWDHGKILEWSDKLKVNPVSLVIGLLDAHLIDAPRARALRQLKLPKVLKTDLELSPSLSPGPRQRRAEMLKRGLSDRYVKLCFDAYEQSLISAGRLAEMLLVQSHELGHLVTLLGRFLSHGD